MKKQTKPKKKYKYGSKNIPAGYILISDGKGIQWWVKPEDVKLPKNWGKIADGSDFGEGNGTFMIMDDLKNEYQTGDIDGTKFKVDERTDKKPLKFTWKQAFILLVLVELLAVLAVLIGISI